jgi:(p)ppGpp synthase/HD superfamily hydrolase
VSAYSPKYDAALVFAARAHRDQVRKGTDIPYVTHPFHVSVLLMKHGFDEDLAIAALLHDVVEDCNVPIAEVEAEFGPRVADLVDAVSERKAEDGVIWGWEERKRASLARLRGGDADVGALKAADALHNVRAITADIGRDGPSVWKRFKRGPDPSIRYYREILAIARTVLPGHSLPEELAQAIDDLERIAAEG